MDNRLYDIFREVAAGTNLGLPYDDEVFNYSWKNTPDLYLTNMIQSGAVVQDAEIARLIANGSNYFTTPFYDVLGGDEDLYNGDDDFTDGTLGGGTMSGVVYGRMKKWSARTFIKDFNSGADPMAQIVAGVAQYWIKKRQEKFIGIIEAIFGISGNSDWSSHISDYSNAGTAQSIKITVTAGCSTNGNLTVTVTSAHVTGSPKAVTVAVTTAANTAALVAGLIRTALGADAAITAAFDVSGTNADVILTSKTVIAYDSTLNIAIGVASTGVTAGSATDNTVVSTITDANKIGETTINDSIVSACGDNSNNFTLAILHSSIANRLANLQLLEFSKYTDAQGIQRPLPIGNINGKTVILNDNVPVAQSPVKGAKEYTSYVLGLGAIRYAEAPVDHPSDMKYDPDIHGGTDMIYTRIRECIHPNGFSFKGDCTTDVAVPNSVLFSSNSWELKMPAKSIMMVKIVTN